MRNEDLLNIVNKNIKDFDLEEVTSVHICDSKATPSMNSCQWIDTAQSFYFPSELQADIDWRKIGSSHFKLNHRKTVTCKFNDDPLFMYMEYYENVVMLHFSFPVGTAKNIPLDYLYNIFKSYYKNVQRIGDQKDYLLLITNEEELRKLNYELIKVEQCLKVKNEFVKYKSNFDILRHSLYSWVHDDLLRLVEERNYEHQLCIHATLHYSSNQFNVIEPPTEQQLTELCDMINVQNLNIKHEDFQYTYNIKNTQLVMWKKEGESITWLLYCEVNFQSKESLYSILERLATTITS